MEFREEINIAHKERVQNEQWERHCKDTNGETIYADFCLFCNCNGIENTEENFNKWREKENREIGFWQLKYLREKYFGYTYEYDYKSKKWDTKKEK